MGKLKRFYEGMVNDMKLHLFWLDKNWKKKVVQITIT